MVMTYTHAKGQGQRSVGSKYKVETDGRTDGRTQATALHGIKQNLFENSKSVLLFNLKYMNKYVSSAVNVAMLA